MAEADSIDTEENKIVGFTKPKKFLFFKMKSKPIYSASDKTTIQKELAKQSKGFVGEKKYTPLQLFILQTIERHKDLEVSLREQNIKSSPYDFVKRMLTISAILAIVITLLLILATTALGVTPLLPVLVGFAVFFGAFNNLINYPVAKSKNMGKEIERNIMFAIRDIIIGMRSGMPLFNAITAVSTGYGAASREFAKVVELVQLGMSIEQAIDDISAKSESKTFKRIMLQASVSIKSGADIVGAFQSTVDEISQERIIELRRYGQTLNALAMFYMLFGVIFPSMGIAVAAILTTFINIFTIDANTLTFGLIGIFFLQIIFLNVMRSSRPVFAV